MNNIDHTLEAIQNESDPAKKLEHVYELVNQLNSCIYIVDECFSNYDELPEGLFHLGYIVEQMAYMSRNLLKSLAQNEKA